MTLAENANQRNYQHLVDQLYQTSDFDFVGVALQATKLPIKSPGNTLPVIGVSNFERLFCVVASALPG
ncbi:hypothetical protein O209_04540 [Lactiplantibacillus plantarum WHE 92]|nr:hypothetical protein O209_04540 [Lactiplantibacillus plantarum WHE 92]